MISALIQNVPTNKLILADCVFTFDLHTLSKWKCFKAFQWNKSRGGCYGVVESPNTLPVWLLWHSAPQIIHKPFSHPTALINLHMRHFSSLDDVHFCKAQTGREWTNKISKWCIYILQPQWLLNKVAINAFSIKPWCLIAWSRQGP